MSSVNLKDNERLDELNREGFQIIQNPEYFCFGMDAVLLSDFASIKAHERAIDLGCGNGIIPILLAAKNPGADFFGLEIMPELVDMARRSIILNGLQDRIEIACGDIRDIDNEKHFVSSSFDVVTANPPYLEADGLISENSARAIARHEIKCNINDIVSAAAYLLRFAGRFYLVHRPHRLIDVFCALRSQKLEPKVLRYVQPKAGKAPNLVLIEAIKGAKPHLKILPNLIIYDNAGKYTKEVEEIYG
ncbi:MAG: tRNA1(Val) (adenine(37)-N6)-methyltransferase [Defluviitaleaceae bacterium]|nr:tRNA1(Val) (adenine(37)-N6)-methyltransferase [Defluviitaleaceae bacterium]